MCLSESFDKLFDAIRSQFPMVIITSWWKVICSSRFNMCSLVMWVEDEPVKVKEMGFVHWEHVDTVVGITLSTTDMKLLFKRINKFLSLDFKEWTPLISLGQIAITHFGQERNIKSLKIRATEALSSGPEHCLVQPSLNEFENCLLPN